MKSAKMLCILLVFLFAVPAIAQTPSQATMDTVRDALKAQKRAFVAVNMQLTEEEEAKFWPLYDAYQVELDRLNKKLADIIDQYGKNYTAMTDATAESLMKQWADLEQDRAKTRILHVNKFKQVLTPIKLVRYFQLENKIQSVINFDLAENIPLMK